MFGIDSFLILAGAVNFTSIPYYLQSQLMLPTIYSAELLCVTVIVLITSICTMAISDNIIAVTLVIFLDLFFCTSIGWVDGWVIVLLTMLVAGLWSLGTMSDILGG